MHGGLDDLVEEFLAKAEASGNSPFGKRSEEDPPETDSSEPAAQPAKPGLPGEAPKAAMPAAPAGSPGAGKPGAVPPPPGSPSAAPAAATPPTGKPPMPGAPPAPGAPPKPGAEGAPAGEALASKLPPPSIHEDQANLHAALSKISHLGEKGYRSLHPGTQQELLADGYIDAQGNLTAQGHKELTNYFAAHAANPHLGPIAQQKASMRHQAHAEAASHEGEGHPAVHATWQQKQIAMKSGGMQPGAPQQPGQPPAGPGMPAPQPGPGMAPPRPPMPPGAPQMGGQGARPMPPQGAIPGQPGPLGMAPGVRPPMPPAAAKPPMSPHGASQQQPPAPGAPGDMAPRQHLSAQVTQAGGPMPPAHGAPPAQPAAPKAGAIPAKPAKPAKPMPPDFQKSMTGLDDLGDYLEKAAGAERAGHKYIRREGAPGGYKYIYAHPQGHEYAVSQREHSRRQNVQRREAQGTLPLSGQAGAAPSAVDKVLAAQQEHTREIQAQRKPPTPQISAPWSPHGAGEMPAPRIASIWHGASPEAHERAADWHEKTSKTPGISHHEAQQHEDDRDWHREEAKTKRDKVASEHAAIAAKEVANVGMPTADLHARAVGQHASISGDAGSYRVKYHGPAHGDADEHAKDVQHHLNAVHNSKFHKTGAHPYHEMMAIGHGQMVEGYGHAAKGRNEKAVQYFESASKFFNRAAGESGKMPHDPRYHQGHAEFKQHQAESAAFAHGSTVEHLKNAKQALERHQSTVMRGMGTKDQIGMVGYDAKHSAAAYSKLARLHGDVSRHAKLAGDSLTANQHRRFAEVAKKRAAEHREASRVPGGREGEVVRNLDARDKQLAALMDKMDPSMSFAAKYEKAERQLKAKARAKARGETLEEGKAGISEVQQDTNKMVDYFRRQREAGNAAEKVGQIASDLGINVDRTKAALDNLGYEIESHPTHPHGQVQFDHPKSAHSSRQGKQPSSTNFKNWSKPQGEHPDVHENDAQDRYQRMVPVEREKFLNEHPEHKETTKVGYQVKENAKAMHAYHEHMMQAIANHPSMPQDLKNRVQHLHYDHAASIFDRMKRRGTLKKGLEELGDYLRKAERIPGGLASGKSPRDFNSTELNRGIKVEMEHTTDRRVAQEIAMDHLTEDPRYYQKLARMEGQHRTEKRMSKSGLNELGEYLAKADGMPDKSDWDEIDKPAEQTLGGSANGGDLTETPDPGGDGTSGPGEGQDKRGQVTGTPQGLTDSLGDDRPPEEQMTPGKSALEQELPEGYKSLTPASQREMVAREHAAKVRELQKSNDVRVGGAVRQVHPYSMRQTHGTTDEQAANLCKSEFYTGGQEPTLAPPGAIIRQTVLCKSESCGCRYPAFLTACPKCGDGMVKSRMLPSGAFVGGDGGDAVKLEKAVFDPIIKPAPVDADVHIPGPSPVVIRRTGR